MMRLVVALLVLVTIVHGDARAFGPKGHHLVGAIADGVLAGKPEAAKVSALLEGITLSDAAVIADDIKEWDEQPTSNYPWSEKPKIYADMKAFLHANPQHRSYHYTDISVNSDLKYTSNKTGYRSEDVVQMIKFCIEVLENKQPQPNARNITPRVAVILLAHYVGDLHQPLHVGAAYFDSAGKRVDPDQVHGARDDQGGNKVELLLAGSMNGVAMHLFWDDGSVDAAIHAIKESVHGTGSTLTSDEIKNHFVAVQPAGWPLNAGVAIEDLSTAWANEMLPLARDAHQRLEYSILSPPVKQGTHYTFYWSAKEENVVAPGYKVWAGQQVDTTVHRAGWRLASLLEELL